MKTMKHFNSSIALCVLSSSTFAQSLDDVFKRADKARSKTEQSVNGSVRSDISKAHGALKDKVDAGDERARVSNEASAASSNDNNSTKSTAATKGGGVDSVRSETYDNAGRKTEGYWVKCIGSGSARVYRSAWDNSRAWYKTGGINGYHLASGDTDIGDVAKKICR